MKIMTMRFLHYMWGKVQHAFDGLTKELSDHRVILNWLYALAYLALIFFCVTTNKESMTAAIYSTAGIVGTIFSAWVVGSAVNNVNRRAPYTAPYTGMSGQMSHMTEHDEEEAAGD